VSSPYTCPYIHPSLHPNHTPNLLKTLSSKVAKSSVTDSSLAIPKSKIHILNYLSPKSLTIHRNTAVPNNPNIMYTSTSPIPKPLINYIHQLHHLPALVAIPSISQIYPKIPPLHTLSAYPNSGTSLADHFPGTLLHTNLVLLVTRTQVHVRYHGFAARHSPGDGVLIHWRAYLIRTGGQQELERLSVIMDMVNDKSI
jgi:hypothetical protein